jgi:phosphoglucosamine mutase
VRAEHPRVLIIRDTRESGEMLEAAVAAGIAEAGGVAMTGGILPTPAAPLLLLRYGLDLAVVLSASHNPFADNGIKFFGADGDKLSDALEEEIELAMGEPAPYRTVGRVQPLRGTLEDYLRALHERFADLDLTGLKVALDCANGATYRAAPEIFRRLGATVHVLADEPDGRNINAGCGSTHIDYLSTAVVAGDHDLGFAFDGDGDRVLAIDRTGEVVDGDELIALAAPHLDVDGVAVTVMTNYGFQQAMQEAGIDVAVTRVGDRYVLEELRKRGWALGGEQSGHIIELGFAPTGDGIAAALLTLEALDGADLSDRGAMRKLPQVLVNVEVSDRDTAIRDPDLRSAIAQESGALEGRGRVLVRPSGTEPLIRVMVEAPTDDEAQAICDRLVASVQAGSAAASGR